MSDDARHGRIPAISSYLQERLQQERRDGDRNSPKTPGGRSISTGGFRDDDVTNSSPMRRSATAMGRQPRSDDGDEADPQIWLGAKEMEKTLSTLHKQNFDLKVELYHRRERQNALEQRNARLERDQADLVELNENVWSELEKRDVALKEAINLIMGLEDRVEELLREREMVRQVEADGTYRHSREDESELEEPTASTPKAQRFPSAIPVNNDKVLGRMPSFMTERGEHTKNLRNVILNDKSSLLSLRKISDSSADASELARATCTSLSVLSESSFKSIYGDKDKFPATPQSYPQDFSDNKVDDLPTSGQTLSKDSWDNQRGGSTSRMGSNGTFKSSADFSSPLQSFGSLFDTPSPLQQVENLGSILASGQIRRPSMASRGSGSRMHVSSPAGHSQAAPPSVKTKQEKREALRRVMTSTPTDGDLAASRALPPTPDTVSTNTLYRYHNSNDTMSYGHRSTPQTSVFDERSKVSSGQYSLTSSIDSRGNATSQPASTTAFTSRREAPWQQFSPDFYANYNQHDHHLPPRPHSACETITSRARADNWSSDSEDSDGGADAYSEDEDSNFDDWMRESTKGDKGHLGVPPQSRNKQRVSRELFVFPGSGWKTEGIVGAMEESGLVSSPASGLKREALDTEPISIIPSEGGPYQPPSPDKPEGGITPPDRRSSLHARTGSMTLMGNITRTSTMTTNTMTTSTDTIPHVAGKHRKDPAHRNSFGKGVERVRSHSIDMLPAFRQQQQQQIQTASMATTKRNQYPPIVGQPTRSRAFSGLNGLFRRAAIDENHGPATPQQQQQFESLRQAKPSGRMSVPPPPARPWALRPSEDELTSATPPPIQRKRGPPTPINANGDAARLRVDTSEVVNTPTTADLDSVPNTPNTPMTPQTASRRSKWLGLGRMGGLKKAVY